MATSSLTHNFIIKDKKAVKRFVDILTDKNGNRMKPCSDVKEISTYLVLNDDEKPLCVCYFTLAIKPANAPDSKVTNKMRKKLKRVTAIDEENKSYLHASCLIAQLGKNYAIDKSKQVTGKKILEVAEGKIFELKEQVGGISCFVECEDNEFLKEFYKENNYSYFDERYGDGIKYLQLMKLI